MRVVDTLWRWAKLGVFLGWGTAAAVLSACSSSPAVKGDTQRPPDSTQTDRARTDAGRVDAKRTDAGRVDAKRTDGPRADAPRDAGTPDRRGWDVPLE
jgi:hypothetical protein